MNVNTALCPQCRKVATFVRQGNFNRCSECGAMYQLADWGNPPGPPVSQRSEVGQFFIQLAKAVLIMLALAVVLLGVAFAGCAALVLRH